MDTFNTLQEVQDLLPGDPTKYANYSPKQILSEYDAVYNRRVVVTTLRNEDHPVYGSR